MTPTQTQTPAPVLPASLRVGAVELTVTDLDRSVRLLRDRDRPRSCTAARAPAPRSAPAARTCSSSSRTPSAGRAGRHSGLYHFALLHPSRLELARAAARLAATRTRITGASDHNISEAIYLDDPTATGSSSPPTAARETWGDISDPTVLGGPAPLDLAGLMSLVENEAPQPHVSPDTVVGHVHLHVGDIDRALAFYRDVIGFEVMTLLDSAAFVAAGGYHHHLGLNIWRGRGAPPVPAGVVGLRHWTIVIPARPTPLPCASA